MASRHRFFGHGFVLLAILLTVVGFTHANHSSLVLNTTAPKVNKSNTTPKVNTSSTLVQYSTSTTKADNPDVPKWVIIGMGAFGIVLLLLIIAMMIYCYLRRRKNRKPELTYMKSDKNANSSYLEFSSAASDTQ
ncbi:hypothetical protein AAVH_05763 [Aphelenchoides avenae]|nr:hypothetical protein AAVH_05763 [Aphelenchus avenae]